VYITVALVLVNCTLLQAKMRSGLPYVLMTRGRPIPCECGRTKIQYFSLVATWTDSGSLVKICGLTWTQKFQYLHISGGRTYKWHCHSPDGVTKHYT